MKFLLVAIIIIIQSNYCVSQENVYNPRILFLTPYSFKYDSSFTKDLQKIEEHIHKINFLGDDLSSHPQNIQTTIQSVHNYTKAVDIRGYVPLLIGERMLFTMFRGKRNFIVLMDTLKVYGTANELKEIADRYNVQHIVYFPEIALYYEDTVGFGSMTMNVYDRATNSIALEYHTTEGWNKEEYEYTERSDEKTAAALLYNLSLHAGHKILKTVGNTNPIYIELRKKYNEENPTDTFMESWELEGTESGRKDCLNLLSKSVLKKDYDLKHLKSILDSIGNSFSINHIYNVLYNTDSTKFVAFLVDPNWDKSSSSNYSINPVEKHCKEAGLLKSKQSNTHNYQGSIIRGVQTSDGWYVDRLICNDFVDKTLEESRLILFCNLYYWHYLNERTKQPLDEFWSDDHGSDDWLFSTVENEFGSEDFPYEGLVAWDKKDPEYTSFEYRTYVEANHILREMEAFEPTFTNNILIPFYKKQLFKPVENNSNYLLIYTGQRDIVLHPKLVTNITDEQVIKYYVFMNNEIYEWTLFTEEVANELTIETVKEKLNTLTGFYLEKYFIIRDTRFWDNYILKKDKSSQDYQYLKRLN